MWLFVKIINGSWLLIIFAKSSILDIWFGFECLSFIGDNNADTLDNNSRAAQKKAAKKHTLKKYKKKHRVPLESKKIRLKQQAVEEAKKAMEKYKTKTANLLLKISQCTWNY